MNSYHTHEGDGDPLPFPRASAPAPRPKAAAGASPRVYFINGIGYSAASTVDRMEGALARRGLNTAPLSYLKTSWHNSRNRLHQYQNAEYMLGTIAAEHTDTAQAPAPCIVAHSHGCLLASRILELAPPWLTFGTLFFFAPAMESEWIWPWERFRSIYVVHNPRDRAIWWAKLMPLDHPWGAMGRDGYRGSNADVRNVLDRSKRAGRFNHSHYFDPPHLEQWTEFVESAVLASTRAGESGEG